ncbi:unnamed protein product [Macrosiphum euphorbiae]|uniref:PiggyBac transposable element-derived protein domain-containing protein n=1 Tax=Macrosiphum euphorbiae TaxID=13131 RepID=A0AAV0VYE2_9HEMI|nr:unnamed protein product [Macrosiphum euphorbiae]
MDEDSVRDYLFSITDEQAECSDIDGDSDFEDGLLITSPQHKNTRSTSSQSDSPAYEPDVTKSPTIPVSSISSSTPPPTLNFSPNDFDIMSMPIEIIENGDVSTEINVDNIVSPNILPISNKLTKKKKKFPQPTLIFKWKKKGCRPKTFRRYKFTQPFGPKVPVDINSPIDIFKLFFDDDILYTFKTQSELYAAQCNQQFVTSIEELQAFFGCLIIMGFHKLPTIRSYWSTDANFQVPRISSIMSLKRFLSILRFLHLNNNLTMPKRGHVNYDKLYKVRPLINKLNEKFFSNFNPSRNIAIDESMVAFKGRTTIKQYMPLKPIKRGIKIWAAACSKTGYLLQFEVYQGKQGDPEIGLGEKVVTHLANLYDNKGYCFYFDGFFSNIPMVKNMVEKNNFACGTIKSNKKYFPSSVLKDDKKLKQGQFDVVTSNEITISKWKDRGKKCVNVISNMHDGSCIGSVSRRDNLGVKQVVKAPAAIVDYNKYMGGVDHFDQFHSYYNVAWKSRRWWLKIFYYLLDASIVNSFVLYQTTSNLHDPKSSKYTHLNFRSTLANQLIGDYSSKKKTGYSKVNAKKIDKKNWKSDCWQPILPTKCW